MKILIYIVALFFSRMVASAVLERVEITGNKRTGKNAIIRHAHINVGQELSEKDLETIKKNLDHIGQFHVKKVEFKEGTLFIEIEDKWTLIPLPMITQSGNYTNRGLVLYNDNFLGSLGTLAPGISWSNSRLNYLLYFQDESLFHSKAGAKVLFTKRSELAHFERQNATVDEHESLQNSFIITPNYLYKDQVFKAGPIYMDKSIYKNETLFLRDKSKGLLFRHHWNAYRSLDFMFEGFVTTWNFSILKSQNDKLVSLNEANILWSIPSGMSFLNLDVHGYHSSQKTYLFGKNLGGVEGVRGYDRASLPVFFNVGATAQWQQHLFHRLYFSPFYEYNLSKTIEPILNGARLSESTVGAGLRYYFKKISIPAVLFDFGRNIEDRSNHFHVNVGISI